MARKKVTPGYLRKVNSPYMSLSVANVESNIPFHGIRNISRFAESLGFEEKEIRRAIRLAVAYGEDTCEFKGWTINWMDNTRWREFIKNHGVNLAPEMIRVYGNLPINKKDYAPSDRSFAVQLFDFIHLEKP